MSVITTTIKGQYAVVAMHREPANVMNLDFWQELQSHISAIHSNRSLRGIIFHSTLKRPVFTAGIDIKELYAPGTTKARFHTFWSTMNKALAEIYTSPLVTVAAVRGASPAGGCMLSLCCDHRLMLDTPGAHIGLNEPRIGISVPPVWMEVFARTVGDRQAEILGFSGTVVGPSEALRIGMIDQVVKPEQGIKDEDKLLGAAEEVMKQQLKIPSQGRTVTKVGFRKDLAAKLGDQGRLDREVDASWVNLAKPETYGELKKVLDRLEGGSKKAKIMTLDTPARRTLRGRRPQHSSADVDALGVHRASMKPHATINLGAMTPPSARKGKIMRVGRDSEDDEDPSAKGRKNRVGRARGAGVEEGGMAERMGRMMPGAAEKGKWLVGILMTLALSEFLFCCY
ncbi:hypothetical protein HK101_001260 [Irineochytrium annulatum]|nr:hypothetical protein HK101_001260 [Irineochytrium annulatum]